MSQDNRQSLADSLLTGVRGNVSQAKSMREVASDLFKPGDYVTIANPFDHETGWVYVDPAEETESRPDKATRRVEYGQPQARVLQVGESRVIQGWEAYIALNRMFKEYAQEQNQSIGVVLQSADEQQKFLKKAYLGIFDPNAVKPTTPVAAIEEATKVDENIDQDPAKIDQPERDDDDEEADLGFAEEGNTSTENATERVARTI